MFSKNFTLKLKKAVVNTSYPVSFLFHKISPQVKKCHDEEGRGLNGSPDTE